MAHAKVVGMDRIITALRALPKVLQGEANREAVQTGAEVLQRAIQASAPRGTGGKPKHYPVADNIIIYERKRQVAMQAEKDSLISMLVGPSKAAYHGYFQEHGWISTGRARRARKATATMHSQRGVSGGSQIPGTHFIARAYAAVRQSAIAAMIETYRLFLTRRLKS